MIFVIFPLLLLTFYLFFNCQFDSVCLSVFLLGFILSGNLWTSWTWLTISFPLLEKFSAIIFANFFSSPSSLFFFWDPYNQMLVHLMLSQSSVRLSSSLFILFCILLCGSDFHHSVLLIVQLFLCLSYSAVDSFQCIIHPFLFVLQFFQVFGKHFLHLLNLCLHSFPEILNHLHYHYSELFFQKFAYLHFINCFSEFLSCLFIWDINFLLFHCD